ncbi:MAG: biotin--[Clostridia bacterium]|nr:biotin--[acetyl-CoA-carboxylase] ligase [Clostridia bacterium]
MLPAIYEYEILPSTNTTAKEMILAGTRQGVILAHRQSAGRGRLGRSFFSENGLFMSVILMPETFTLSPALLTSAAAVAVCRTLRARGFDIGIKWVNDLHYEGKKICGILTEAVSNGSEILGYVVGIGLNLGNSDFPEELRDIATSLPIAPSEKRTLLHEIVRTLDETLSDSAPALVSYLTAHSVVLGKPIRFFGAQCGEGLAVGLDHEGGLIVETEDGPLTLTTGEISVRVKK